MKDGSIAPASRHRPRAAIALIVLVPFLWLASGADAWAQSCLLRDDPDGFLAQLADNRPYAVPVALRAQVAALSSRSIPTTRRPGRHATRRAALEIGAMEAELAQPASARVGATPAATALLPLVGRLDAAHREIEGDLDATEALIATHALAPVVAQRQLETRARYLAQRADLLRALADAGSASDPVARGNALESARALLASTHDRRPEQPFDASHLPFGVADATPRPPRTDWSEAPASRSAAPLAAAAGASASAPTPADLAPNEDVQITPAIQALAASLGNQPLAIFEWVRNQVQFHPTWGSVQGSELTRVMRRGNAFDIASLLVALLRAAGVPARYVLGTVSLPVSDALNWAGNAASVSIAQQLLSSGGISNVAILNGGTVVSLEVEHVWVEAYVDFVPSRGAVHVTGDTWVPLDAAYKRSTFTPAAGVLNAVPLGQVLASAGPFVTVDESLGQLSSANQDALEGPLETWAEQVGQYVETQGIPKTREGALGGRAIVPLSRRAFAGTLPYAVVSSAAPVSTLPSSVRHRVQVIGYASSLDRALDNPDFSAAISFPALGSGRLSLQFPPATPADAATLDAARQSSASALPISLVNVRASLALDGAQLAAGSVIGMGDDYFLDVVLAGPDGSTVVPYDIIAGDESVVGVTGNGFTSEALQDRLTIHPVNDAPEYLHQVNLHYWAESDALNDASGLGLAGHVLRLPSVGLFSSPLTVTYVFGQPSTGVYASRFMDVKRSFVGVAAPTPSDRVTLTKQSGLNGSYLEGTTFDQLEPRTSPAIKGLDAVKLLGAASSQGIPLYRITPANQAAVLPRLQLDASTESNIQSALAQGQTVFAPERNVNLGPWSGAGYILQSETDGTGAYLISGGLNGGGLPDCIEDLVPIFVLVLAIVLIAVLLWFYGPAIAAGLAVAGASGAGAWAAFLLFLRSLAPLMVGV